MSRPPHACRHRRNRPTRTRHAREAGRRARRCSRALRPATAVPRRCADVWRYGDTTSASATSGRIFPGRRRKTRQSGGDGGDGRSIGLTHREARSRRGNSPRWVRIEGRVDGFLVRQIDQRLHRARGPTERRSSARRTATGERLGKQFGHDRPNRSAFPCVDGFDLSQNGVVDIECRSHDA